MGGTPKVPPVPGAPPPPPSPAQITPAKPSGSPNLGGTYLTGALPQTPSSTGQRKSLFGQ